MTHGRDRADSADYRAARQDRQETEAYDGLGLQAALGEVSVVRSNALIEAWHFLVKLGADAAHE